MVGTVHGVGCVMTCITMQEAEANRNRVVGISNLLPKIEWAKLMIKYALGHSSNPVINFSGGKDSLVVLDLVRRIRPTTIGVFANTGIEYKETVPYALSFDNIVELHPDKSFWQCEGEYGLPVMKSKAKRHGNMCCLWLKEKPLVKYYKENNVDLSFTGLTADESRQRKLTLMRMGPYYWHKSDLTYKCHPIYDWTSQDVWDYINFFKLPYNPIYDMGIARCGCRFCTAYLNWKKTTELYNPLDTQILARKQGYALISDFEDKTELYA